MNLADRIANVNGGPYIFSTGQAGYIFKSMAGTIIGIDLYLSDCVERYDGFKRLCPKQLYADEIILDAVIATHWHLDHFDVDSMPILLSNGKTWLYAANDCKEHVKDLNLDEKRIKYLSVGDSVSCDDIKIQAVFCDHGEGAPLAIGIVISIDGFRIYFAGDTCLRLDRAKEVAEYGPFDIMIAPINGAFGNLNERECVELAEFHRPKLVIPCHYWMFAEQHGDPGLFVSELKRKLPDQNYLLMRAGEDIDICKMVKRI